MTEVLRRGALWGASLLALAAFAWPLVFSALPTSAQSAVPFVVFALVPALIVGASLLLDRDVASAKTVAMLGLLAGIGTAVRVASTGIGGFEAVFIVLILGGRAFGARFGFLLGVATITVSSIVWGGFGPWTAFQAFAAGWVGAGAGLLPINRTLTPDRRGRRREIAWLIGYGVVASYLFGALMNLWFWPFAVGSSTAVSYLPGADLATNLSHFGVYTLLTSTLTWDTVRALTTAIGLALFGVPALAALRRAKL
ncbi:MAG: ECF transporter S component [Microbacteriaceae bacterium]